jgi:hypothetical protein
VEEAAIGPSAHRPTKKGPTDERARLENFGVSYDQPFGHPREAHEGAGGKIDSAQRDMGRTGEVM